MSGPRALCLLLLGWPALMSAQPQAQSPPDSLRACAAIVAPGARLACYDRLAGRPVDTPARSAAPAAEALTAPPVQRPDQSFGLHIPEHPAPQKLALTARVVSIAVSADGHLTVALEGGQLWELDGPDALVASGDTVIIRRAALGSFLMTTAQARVHRVRRLR